MPGAPGWSDRRQRVPTSQWGTYRVIPRYRRPETQAVGHSPDTSSCRRRGRDPSMLADSGDTESETRDRSQINAATKAGADDGVTHTCASFRAGAFRLVGINELLDLRPEVAGDVRG